jgi:hypothetical protein
MRHRRSFLVLVVLFVAAAASPAVATPPPRFLIFHVDAVSAHVFDALLAAGRLPHLERAFADGERLTALTLFPASTPMIYPRLHTGGCNADPGPIGFGGYDREAGRALGETEVFLGLLGRMPAPAATNLLLHGLPGFDGLASLAMQNLPDLLERHRTVEFFWFSTDTFGHLRGEEEHARSLERFDAALAAVWPRLRPDDLNVIVYGDHGLTFTTETVDLDEILRDRVGDAVRHFSYPNLYLHDPSAAPALAFALTRPGGLDYAFYRVDAATVDGYVDGDLVRFEADGEGLRYRSAADPLGYRALGYAGEALDPDAWLALTIGSRYPATPVNLFRYLQHPDVGDVVGGFNPPRIPLTSRANQGNHAGLVDTDLVTPVLVRGPDVGALAARETLWLHTLYRDLPELRFGIEPAREPHSFGVWLRFDGHDPGAWLRLSPVPRQHVALEATPGRLALWSEVDVVATYLSRGRVGFGVALQRGTFQPLARAELQIDAGDARFTAFGSFAATGWTAGVAAGVRLANGLRVTWLAPDGVAIGVEW